MFFFYFSLIRSENLLSMKILFNHERTYQVPNYSKLNTLVLSSGTLVLCEYFVCTLVCIYFARNLSETRHARSHGDYADNLFVNYMLRTWLL